MGTLLRNFLFFSNMSLGSNDSSIGASRRENGWSLREVWTQSSSDEQVEIPRGAERNAANGNYTRQFWLPIPSNNNFYADSEAESYLKGDGVSTCSSLSTASSIEYGRGVSTRNPTFTRNPNFDKLKNPPKEKNMAEYGWGNVEDLEDPFWDRIRRQNRREEQFKYRSEPSFEIQKEPPRLLKIRKQK